MSDTPTRKSQPSPFVITRDDFEEAFVGLVDLIRDVRTDFSDQLSSIRDEVQGFSDKLKEDTLEDVDGHKASLAAVIEDALVRIDTKLASVKDGVTPVKGVDYFDGEHGFIPVKGVHYNDGKDGSPDTGDDILTKIHESEGLIDINKIAGIEELETRLAEKLPAVGAKAGWGAHPLRIENTSAAAIEKVARTIRFKGNGVSVSRTKDGVVVVDISGGTGSSTALTPTGTVNGSNTVFGVASQPAHVVADGITYYEGAGYSYAAPNITMDVPPSQYIKYYA